MNQMIMDVFTNDIIGQISKFCHEVKTTGTIEERLRNLVAIICRTQEHLMRIIRTIKQSQKGCENFIIIHVIHLFKFIHRHDCTRIPKRFMNEFIKVRTAKPIFNHDDGNALAQTFIDDLAHQHGFTRTRFTNQQRTHRLSGSIHKGTQISFSTNFSIFTIHLRRIFRNGSQLKKEIAKLIHPGGIYTNWQLENSIVSSRHETRHELMDLGTH